MPGMTEKPGLLHSVKQIVTANISHSLEGGKEWPEKLFEKRNATKKITNHSNGKRNRTVEETSGEDLKQAKGNVQKMEN
ncbi:hypothetical protein E2320_002721 [Naja naja]|nr:hypothetical protein E2320_002721 [Naja naja]